MALITGAARGIGRSTAIACARNGFDVVLNFSRSRSATEAVAGEVGDLGARSLLFQADVADEARVVAMLEAVRDEFGRLDALVNNAGTTVSTPPSDLAGLRMEDWDRVFAVNVRGTFQVTRAAVAAPARIPSGGGGQPREHRGLAAGPATVSLRRK